MPNADKILTVAEVHKQLDQMEARWEALEKRKAAEAAAERDSTLRKKLGEALEKAGAAQHYVKFAVGYLVDSANCVKMTEEGSLIFDDGMTELPIDRALHRWLNTTEARHYLARSHHEEETHVQSKNTNSAPNQPSREELAVKLRDALSGPSITIG